MDVLGYISCIMCSIIAARLFFFSSVVILLSLCVTVKNTHYVAYTAKMSRVWGDRKGLVQYSELDSGQGQLYINT